MYDVLRAHRSQISQLRKNLAPVGGLQSSTYLHPYTESVLSRINAQGCTSWMCWSALYHQLLTPSSCAGVYRHTDVVVTMQHRTARVFHLAASQG